MPPNEVLIKVKAEDKASGPLQALAGKLGGRMKAGALGLGAAVAAVGVKAVSMAADFEQSFAEVTTLFDAPKEQIEGLRQGVLNLSKEMGVNATEATHALYQAISAGVPPENAIDFLRENTKLAVGGVTNLTTAVDLTTTVLNAFGLKQSELTHVADVMFGTVKAGKTTIDELGASLFQVAPTAAGVGVSIEEVGAAMATLTARGFPTAQAATGLNAAMAELAKGGTDASSAFKDLTGAAFPDFIASGGNMGEALALMNEGALDADKSIIDMFGSIEAGKAVMAITKDGGDKVAATFNDLLHATGDIDEAFGKMNETAARQWAVMKERLNVALIELGTEALPLMVEGMEAVIPLLEAMIALGTPLVKGIGGIAKAIDAVGDSVDKLLGGKTNEYFDTLAEAAEGNTDALKDLAQGHDDVAEAAQKALAEQGIYVDEAGQEIEGLTDRANELKDAMLTMARDSSGGLEGLGDTAETVAGEQLQELIDQAGNARNALFNMYAEPTQEELEARAHLAALQLWLKAVERQTGLTDFAEGTLGDTLKNHLIPATEDEVEWLGLQRDAAGLAMEATYGTARSMDQLGTDGHTAARGVEDADGKIEDFKATIAEGLTQDMIDDLFSTGEKAGEAAGKVTDLDSGLRNLPDHVASTVTVNIQAAISDAVSAIADLIGFQAGGTVPGPIGQPRLAVVHGGEEVIPVGGGGGEADGGGQGGHVENVYIEQVIAQGDVGETLAQLSAALPAA